MLMHMEYRVRLPDHDFTLVDWLKLTSSVYAILSMKSGRITYSGPTFIAIRSAKHAKRTAETHLQDFQRLLELPKQKTYHDGQCKPVQILSCDGGPDESPGFLTLQASVAQFKKYDLDAVFVGTYAPGQSAYNPVERRMAPLSKDLAGIILPYETFGSHLNYVRETADL
ncbi:unnamed protein product, partial [Allacma fusca]